MRRHVPSVLAGTILAPLLVVVLIPSSGRAAASNGASTSSGRVHLSALDGLIFRVEGIPSTAHGKNLLCGFAYPQLVNDSDPLQNSLISTIRQSSTGWTASEPGEGDYVFGNGNLFWMSTSLSATQGGATIHVAVDDPDSNTTSCTPLPVIASSPAGSVYSAREQGTGSSGCMAFGSNGTTTAITVELGGCDPSLFPPITPLHSPPPPPSPRYFPTLSTTDHPFVVTGLAPGSEHAWEGLPSPPLRFFTSDEISLAASYVVLATGGATWSVTHPDAYSRLGIIDRGVSLTFTGRLPSSIRVTFSLVDTKALVANLFLHSSVDSLNNLLVAFENGGPGAALLAEVKREVQAALTGQQSRIAVIKAIGSMLVKFGADSKNRAWLIKNFGTKNILFLALWVRDVAQAAGAYAGLGHAGVGGKETVTLSAQPLSS